MRYIVDTTDLRLLYESFRVILCRVRLSRARMGVYSSFWSIIQLIQLFIVDALLLKVEFVTTLCNLQDLIISIISSFVGISPFSKYDCNVFLNGA